MNRTDSRAIMRAKKAALRNSGELRAVWFRIRHRCAFPPKREGSSWDFAKLNGLVRARRTKIEGMDKGRCRRGCQVLATIGTT